MSKHTTIPVQSPTAQSPTGASRVTTGAPISPSRRLIVMEPKEWEEFVAEWVHSLKPSNGYHEVHRCGGAGDLGRDVIAYKDIPGPSTCWDNYQCKHYNRPLSVTDIVTEVGKLFYYVSNGSISAPDSYMFVCPHGPSTELLKCMEKGQLKQELIKRWDKTCRKKIAKNVDIPLDQNLMKTLDAFDFQSISVMPPLDILEGHRKTPYYAVRFGGGLPARMYPPPPVPSAIQPEESRYIQHLLDAYSDDLAVVIPNIPALETQKPELHEHLHRSREHFFSAESLRTFSRDNVPAGTYEALQNEFCDGVQEVYKDAYQSGYRRVVETVKAARLLQITSSPLIDVLRTNDRAGICHQLANDDRLVWIGKKP